MRTRHFINSLAILLFVSLAGLCKADEPADSPSAFVTELTYKAPLFMSSRTLTSIERQRRLEGLLEEYFDMPRIARFVLGNYWQSANDTDRREFTKVLRDVLARTYSDRFTRYSRESFRVTSQRDLEAENMMVYSEVGNPVLGEQTKVGWIVARRDSYKITDIIVADASMAKIMHDDFGSYLKRNGGDLPNLIRELQAKLSAEKSD
jgi:phospholipid transport system substrate-binding protein